ncbi:DUF4031 domain-containing protein [Rhizobium halophytocola]|uniref:DUF4031 domain-containing protein n=1 Tax=Rhizobium halophytocola TaxID=735519 RepID=A0ABS4E1V0_9HYPH|nr:DUF4031 domain-containing protein [Rhizobium halophytocola]MBP1851896.1 hypothetical protein [Rhizobium halophytocola]
MVYVDDMQAPFRGMIMCHMVADTSEELLEMADRIGMAHRWIQWGGTYREHFDISLERRQMAVEAGAVEISRLALGRIIRSKKDRAPAA